MIRPAAPADLERVHALLAARDRATLGADELQLQHLRADWAMPSFSVGEDNWVAEDDTKLVGYAALDAAGELVHGAREPAVGEALLERAEERARRRGLDAITVTVVREDEPLHALVERAGFGLRNAIWRMWRNLDGELPVPALPPEVALRTYDAHVDAEAVHALLDEAYSGWERDYVPRSHADWRARMTAHDDFDAALWFLVERDGEIVGAALHWHEYERTGWVKDIVVRDSERGRGVGKALLQHGFREYASRGATRVGLKVDSTNPTGALELYARLGFVTDRSYDIWTKRP